MININAPCNEGYFKKNEKCSYHFPLKRVYSCMQETISYLSYMLTLFKGIKFKCFFNR